MWGIWSNDKQEDTSLFKTRSISYSTVCISKFSNFEFFRCCHVSSKTCWEMCFFLCRHILLHILHVLYLQGAPGTPGLDVSHFETIYLLKFNASDY